LVCFPREICLILEILPKKASRVLLMRIFASMKAAVLQNRCLHTSGKVLIINEFYDELTKIRQKLILFV
jgi:hypothetical protein